MSIWNISYGRNIHEVLTVDTGHLYAFARFTLPGGGTFDLSFAQGWSFSKTC